MPEPHRWKLVLAYLPLLGLIPLFIGQPSREVRWHARNGILLSVAFAGILGAATAAGLLLPSLSCFYGIGVFALAIVYGIVVILAIVKALQGQRLVVRGLSSHADRG
ncbi:MAG TPA: hypothetical protein VE007_12435 [Thermoanaerobaculia bacterium]|nr:hypothetical protein [Thermoanaerobaculia bacterium]